MTGLASDDDAVSSETENSVMHDVDVIDGKWSEWSPWSECGSECVVRRMGEPVVGIVSSFRRCDHPSPRNSGKGCVGSGSRHRLCDAQAVSPNTFCHTSHAHSSYITLQYPLFSCFPGLLCFSRRPDDQHDHDGRLHL